ncbi:hypothetical protein B0A48_03567 [Cryoendolithus antarcticus]|uniref:Uncharacterized protein n=1 Tax=Cryoendolithus antarcticus TaxID=1507870 RepID=A0A1V8TKD5_9PEZI|nr:hypothetical protein B0A48_03567 [Cryoendolithus antarcticus]
MDDADHPSPARRAEIVDDLLYGAYVLQDQWKHYQPDGAEPDRDSKGKGRLGQLDNLQTLQTQRKDVVIRLIDALSDLKTIVDEAGFCGEGGGGTFSTSDSSTFVSLADKCKRMMQELETIDNHQTFVSQQPGHAVRTVEGETRKLRDLRARRYYNLEAVLQFERFRADVPLTEYERLCRMAATPTLPYPHFVKTKVSYIRAHKHICIILVDGPPGPKLLSDVAFRNTVTNASIALPGIARFTAGYSTIIAQSSLYAMCQSFAGHRWHTEVLCSDQQVLDDSTDESREISSHSNVRPDPGAWAACDPQSLLYLISSSLWETKLRLLDAEIGTMSYCQMPRATTAKELFEINGSLHDYRNQLNVLKRKVGVLDTRMPEGFGKYYDAIPRIRRRGRATYLFPVVHHKNILERAQDLDKLLMDSFQVLTSSVSVHESHESTRQTRRATWIAVLAFFYLPATLVTGIFGMNIKQASDGFAWWAPLLALLAVILTTASAFGAFILIRRWRKRAKAKAEKQKLSIEKSA